MTRMPSSTSSSEVAAFRKLIGRVIIMAALLALVLTPLARIYDREVPLYTKYKQHWILARHKQNFDYAFMGASRVANTIMPAMIDSLLGTNGVNLGVGGGDAAEQALLMDKFYANGNSSRFLVIEVCTFMLGDPKEAMTHPFSDEKYLHLIGDPVCDSIIRANTNPLKYYPRRYLPFFKYAEYNNFYSIDRIYTRAPLEFFEYDHNKGYTDFHVHKGDLDSTQNLHTTQRSVVPECQAAFEHMIRTALRHNTKVILYTSPTYSKLFPFEKGRTAARDTIKAIAARYGLAYYDYEEQPEYADKKNFSDYTHLNAVAGRRFNLQMSELLKPYLGVGLRPF